MHDERQARDPGATSGTPLPESVLTGPRAVAAGASPQRGVHSAGLDLVDVDRLQLALARSHGALTRRLFAADEQSLCASGHDRDTTAALFGVKESIVKVIGGMPRRGRYTDMSIGDLHIRNGNEAAPILSPVQLRGELGRWADIHRVTVLAGATALTDALTLAWAVGLRTEPSC